MKIVSEHIPGYSYGAAEVTTSPVSRLDLEELKTSAGFTEEDQRYLQLEGEVLAGQTKQIVDHWRSGIIASIPNLARHSRSPEGAPSPSIWQRAICVLSNGSWTLACDLTIRTGSTISRRLLCDTRAQRRTRLTEFTQHRLCRSATL